MTTRPPPLPNTPRSSDSAPDPTVRATRILRELATLLQELGRQQGLGAHEKLPLQRLQVAVDLDLTQRHQSDDAGALVEALRHLVSESLAARGSFRLGRVYCFQCHSQECPHALPPDKGSVFAGYTGTGKPTWTSFITLCVERQHARVDQLFADSPTVISLAQVGADLTGMQLRDFGRDSAHFRVVGQVVAGLLPSEWQHNGTHGERSALTVQVVHTSLGRATPRLRMNLIGVGWDELAHVAIRHGPKSTADRLRALLRQTEQDLDRIGHRAHAAQRSRTPIAVDELVEALLARVSADIERIFREPKHRTRHAVERHQEGERPTQCALSDAVNAPHERLMHDVERDTIVVLGPKGRTHIFSPAGRHVTSLFLQPGELERKSGRARWRPLESTRIDEFHKRLADQMAATRATDAE